ncbi:MAG: SufB/SufD family protein, partial [Acidimicrobiales bacterium]
PTGAGLPAGPAAGAGLPAGQPAGPGFPPALAALLAGLGPLSAAAVVRDGRVTLTPGADPAVTVESPGDEAWPIGAVSGEPDAFACLNAASTLAPLRVHIGRGHQPGATVVVVNWLEADGAAAFPRLLVHAEANTEAAVVEVTASADVASLVVPVTELDVAPGANLAYTNVQLLGPRAWQVGLQASRVGRDATLTSASVALGGDYARVRTDSSLVGDGASGRLVAVWFASGTQMPDLRTVQDHQAAKTSSDLVFKGAVAGQAHSVYTGLIRVAKGAAGTNAMQTNRNLVLSEGAQADSVPNLEIEDNDVRCSHASAVGPIEPDQRFYLESRGVPTEVADRLVTLGFLDDVLARVPAAGLRPWLRLEMAARLEAAEAAEAGAAAAHAAEAHAAEAGAAAAHAAEAGASEAGAAGAPAGG